MPTVHEAFQFLETNARELFGTVGTMLYVGHRGDTRPWWCNEFSVAIGGPRLEVLDIDKGNLGSAQSVTPHLHLGDVRTFPISGFGLVFWDEGPEHLPRDESLAVLSRLAATNDHVLISCPWGYHPQGSGPTDIEFHHWGPVPADFEGIGFTARTFGTMFNEGHGHGNLIAWT